MLHGDEFESFRCDPSRVLSWFGTVVFMSCKLLYYSCCPLEHCSFSVSFILSTVSKTPPNFANQQAVTAHTFTPLEECVECACVCESGTRAQRWSIGQNWHPNFVSYYYYYHSTVEVARGRQRAAETPTSWRHTRY